MLFALRLQFWRSLDSHRYRGATVTAPHWRGSIHINSFLKKYATGNPIGAAVAFAVALSVFQPVATISGNLISSWDNFRSVRVARAPPFDLAQIKALTHLRYHVPPSQIA